MAITFEIPAVLRLHSHGDPVVSIGGPCESVADALGALGSRYPGVVDRVLTEQGELRPHVNLFVDNENTRHTDGLRTPVSDHCTITILAAISGG